MYFQPQQPGGGIPNPNQQPPNPQQQAAMARMIRPNLGPGPHSHHSQMSPNVAASPAQPIQQMGGVYPHPGSTGGPIPFSPQQQHGGMGGGPSAAAVYSQQMMTPMGSMGQPHSQQMLGSNNPMSVSDAPATPATPQQQQQLQQPHSIGSHLQQPGSVQQLQQPSSIGPIPMATPNPAASAGGGGGGPFLSGTAPSSVGSITSAGGRPTQQSQQPPPTQIPAQPTLPELDPIAAAKMLILKDLRKAIVEFNQCAEKSVERMLSTELTTTTIQSVGGGMVPSSSEKQQHEEKKMMTTTAAAGMPSAGGPHSNLGPGGPHSIGGGPQSNLGFGGPHSVNPHSVQNPLSVQNPQSVNPQSVSAIPPGSVKSASADEAGISGRKDLVELSPNEQYEMARDQFLNVCDNIERNMALILEVNRQQGKLYNPQANTAVAWLQMPSELNEPTSTLPQVLHGFAELMNADKQAIKSNIDGLNSLMERVNNGQKKE